jgi:hypothetical protein
MHTETDPLLLVRNAAKYITPVGVIVLLLLQGQFVSRTDFEIANSKLSGRVEKIEQVLIRMEAGAEVDRRHTELLADHEARIRTLELHPKP